MIGAAEQRPGKDHMADLELVRRLVAADQGLAIVSTTRADGTIQASLVKRASRPIRSTVVMSWRSCPQSARSKTPASPRPGRTRTSSPSRVGVGGSGRCDQRSSAPTIRLQGFDAPSSRALLRRGVCCRGRYHDDWAEYRPRDARPTRTAVLVGLDRSRRTAADRRGARPDVIVSDRLSSSARHAESLAMTITAMPVVAAFHGRRGGQIEPTALSLSVLARRPPTRGPASALGATAPSSARLPMPWSDTPGPPATSADRCGVRRPVVHGHRRPGRWRHRRGRLHDLPVGTGPGLGDGGGRRRSCSRRSRLVMSTSCSPRR